ncbi:sialidase family protein [Flindersiella endophytica]
MRLRGLVTGFGLAVALLGLPAGSVAPVALTRATFPGGDGGSPDAPAWVTGPEWNVLNWGPGPVAAIAAAAAIDTVVDGRTQQRVFVSTNANQDVATADTVSNMSFSLDSGLSFLTTERNFSVSALNMARLPDGSMISIEFIPEWANDAHTAIHILTSRSADQGKTWRAPVQGLFTPPPGKEFGGTDRGLRIHRRPMVLPDGTWLVPAYGTFKGERGSSMILQSTDQGETWTLRSQIPAGLSTNEVGWARTTSGELLAAIRTAENPARLQVSRSFDDAKTWTAATPLIGPDGKQVAGIFPDLVLQPNGVLLLGTGRPDGRVLVSYAGDGRTWDDVQTVFANYPSDTLNGRYDGTSGNNSIVNVGASRSIFFGDTCAVWGCGAYNEQFGVYAKYVSAVTPGVGKLDVATQLREGVASVEGTFAKPVRRFPETRPAGAFDGSSRPNAAAVLQAGDGTAPSMVLKLDRPYTLDRIGLMLGSGEPASGAISLSLDGKTWSEPVVETSGTRDYALRYKDFPAQRAQYVKVVAPAGRATAVTELELYASDVQTFENDPIFDVPRGFVDAKHAWTTDVDGGPGDVEMGGYRSSTALRLWDKWTDDNATATKPAPEAGHQVTSFQWGTTDFRGPFVFGIDGRADSGPAKPWQFRLVNSKPAQTLEMYDGSAWIALGTLSTAIPVHTWVPITVDATLTSATVSIGGQEFTASKPAAAADALAGVTFSTGDPTGYGMLFVIDDLTISGS